MNKIKLLSIAVLGLLLINICVLSLLFNFLSDQPDFVKRNKKHPEPKYIIIEKLHLDEHQIIEYEKLIREHRKNINLIDLEIRNTKSQLYSTLTSSPSPNIDSLKNKLSELQGEIEMIHYNHFAAIKRICKPNQLVYFDNLTKELEMIFSSQKNSPHPPKD